MSDGTQKGKLADAALQIASGELAGIEVVGFTVWYGRNGPNVTFPARKFAGRDGKEHAFSFVRSVKRADTAGMSRLRVLVLEAYQAATRNVEPIDSAQSADADDAGEADA